MINLIASKVHRFIKFPSENEIPTISRRFRQKQGFPNVIGCVDGTHIPVLVPKNDLSETYRNRKGYMSLNVQMVAGHNEEIFDIVARWPGSTHDAVIWTTCRLNGYLSTLESTHDFHLLGDSAY